MAEESRVDSGRQVAEDGCLRHRQDSGTQTPPEDCSDVAAGPEGRCETLMLSTKYVRAAIAGMTLMGLAAIIMCPVGTAVVAAVVFLASCSFNPGMLTDRLLSTGVVAGIASLVLIPAVEKATVPWAVCCAVPLTFLLGKQRPGDERRYKSSVPEALPEKKPGGRRRNRGQRRGQRQTIDINVHVDYAGQRPLAGFDGPIIDVTPRSPEEQLVEKGQETRFGGR